jgi:hypothetical protein
MSFVRQVSIGLLLWLCIAPLCAMGATPYQGNFSHGAIDIWTPIAGNENEATFMSPDKSWTITVGGKDDDILPVRVKGRLGNLDFKASDLVNAELVWAPDSSAAFYTGSDGGSVGNYHVHVFYRRHGKLVHRDLTSMIKARFGHPVRCYDPEDPNVGGIAWLGKGRLLVAAEILPHSNCDSMGTFKAYVVDTATLKVIKTYDQLSAKRLFYDKMGLELRGASDICVRRPRDCEIPALHGHDN